MTQTREPLLNCKNNYDEPILTLKSESKESNNSVSILSIDDVYYSVTVFLSQQEKINLRKIPKH